MCFVRISITVHLETGYCQETIVNCQKEVIVSITIVIERVLAVELGQVERVIPQTK